MNVFDVPSDPAFWQDPAPFYRSALQHGGGLFTISSGGYSVIGYQALFELGRDPRVEGFPFPEKGFGPGLDDLHRLLRWGLFALGAPQHRSLRLAAIAGLSSIRDDDIRQHARRIAAELSAAMQQRRDADLVGDFCKPLASRMFCRLLGLDETEADGVTEAIDAITDQLNGVPDRAASANAAAAQLFASMERVAARSPVISAINARLATNSPASAVDLTASFIFDAVEMVATGLFGVTDFLMRRDDFRDAIAAGAYSVKDAVQEAFRLVTPATLTSRMALETLEWRGQTIEQGTPLMMWWGSGNLDPAMFDEPERFHPNRPVRRHLAFGIGGHACIGRQFASTVAEEAVSALLLDPEARVEPLGETVFLPRLARMAERARVTFA
ncbi:cytochrome P450 [Devosia albogilva]|uniref:Cytochrome P450 n=1 Tax=Devosia albogilva TaxID=429726 RepID=A0ABW5QQB0_9HYPH